VKVDASFVLSAASAGDFPRDEAPEIALVGRSNVGKSSLINALVRRRLARTSSTPGKTRLANVYRVARGSAPPFYLVDLPGFGYARRSREETRGETVPEFEEIARIVFARTPVGLLFVDARHPGLESDRQAWAWMAGTTAARAVVATKIDKLSRSERQRAMKTNDAVFETPVLPVSAVTGEGLDELWKLIDRLLSSSSPRHRNRRPSPMETPGPPPRRRKS
jgi:GTP-binding protein